MPPGAIWSNSVAARAAGERVDRPGRAVDQHQIDAVRQRAMIVPEARPVAGRRPQRHRAQIGLEAVIGQPVARRVDEILMLVEADQLAAAGHLQRPGEDQGRGAGAELDDQLRPCSQGYGR